MNAYLKHVARAAFAVAALTSLAHALVITPSSGTLNVSRWEGGQTAQPQIDAAIAPLLGTSTEVYKQNVGGSEEGSLAGSYTTTFSNSPADPADALIDYISGPIVNPTRYLLVKDGNQDPAWYLFNLSTLGWNGTEDLVLTGFWPQQGAISHVSLYGGPGTGVPDGGATVALLGLGLTVLAFARRMLA